MEVFPGVFLKFTTLLKKEGFPIHPQAEEDMFRALHWVDLRRKDQVYLALKATLLKDIQQEEKFRECFEEFFQFLPFGKKEEKIQEILGQDPVDFYQYLKERADRIGMEESPELGEGYYRYRLLKELEEEGFFSFLKGKEGDLSEEAYQEVRGLIRQFVHRELKRKERLSGKETHDSFLKKSFYHISPEDLPRMIREVERLSHRLRHAYSRRLYKDHKGRPNLSKTLRKNFLTDTVLFKLYYRQAKRKRLDLILFVDVSASVRNASAFMLTFAYAFQDLFERVRTFAFVTRCVEITHFFRTSSIQLALDAIMRGEVLDIWEDSDYGAFLRSLEEYGRDLISPRTTLLILGDGRSNYHDPEVKRFQRVVRSARAVLWFNPEPKGSWGFGDSVIYEYAPYCSKVVQVSSLEMLIQALDLYLIPARLG